MVNCVVARYKNSSSKISKCRHGITFHRFPNDQHRRLRWEIAVNREKEWASTASCAVCSEHFEAEDFYLTSGGLRRLTQEALPVINISACEEPQPTVSVTTVSADIKAVDSEEVMLLKNEVKRLSVIANNRKRQIKVLWQANRSLTAKYESIKYAVQHNLVKKKHSDKICI